MKTTIILLRGVMPTGKNKVLMAPLRTALEEVGLSQVRTYIQSGNVIVSTRLACLAVERLVHETIKEQLGAELKVLARHVPYFEEVLARNPFSDEDPAAVFHAAGVLPEAATLAAFQALDHAPDQVRVVGDMAYVRCHTKYSDVKANKISSRKAEAGRDDAQLQYDQQTGGAGQRGVMGWQGPARALQAPALNDGAPRSRRSLSWLRQV